MADQNLVETWNAERVQHVLRDRWVRPNETPTKFRVPTADVDRIARQVLDAMLTRPFRVTTLPNEEEHAELLSRVTHWVARGRPISIRLGYGPMKNLNNVAVSRADWAEFFALTHLCTWFNKAQEVYPPGLRIKIVFDDSTIRMANNHGAQHMRSYMSTVWDLVRALGYQRFIVGTMRQSAFAWLFHFGLYQWAERRVNRWESDPANAPAMETMQLYASRNLLLPEGLSESQKQAQWKLASHRYRVYWEALQLSGLTKLGRHLVAMYLDGEQHHQRQSAAFHLTSLGKGIVVQPWQGAGMLQDNGHGKLVPTVLTSARRAKVTATEVPGLNLFSLPGFDRIQVGTS